MKKYIVFCFAMLSMAFSISGMTVNAIGSFYAEPVALLSSFKEKDLMHDHDLMVQFFTYFNTSSYALIKKIRADIKIVEKHIKQYKNHALHVLRDQLHDLITYIKRHRVNNDAIIFHANIQDKYQSLFDMVAEEKDVIDFIHNNRPAFNLEKEDNWYLNNFVKDLKQIASRVSEFEDYIHSDYIDLKLMNYVFKIELIKLRNAILFDKRYKKRR